MIYAFLKSVIDVTLKILKNIFSEKWLKSKEQFKDNELPFWKKTLERLSLISIKMVFILKKCIQIYT